MRKFGLLMIVLACIAANKEANTDLFSPRRFFLGGSVNFFTIAESEFETAGYDNSGTSFGGVFGIKIIPQVAAVVKVHAWETKQEGMVPGVDLNYKFEWNQYFVTFAGRYYPLVMPLFNPYLDVGLVHSNVTESFEAAAQEGHFLIEDSETGFGLGVAGGVQMSITPEISLFGEIEYDRVKILDIDVGGPHYGGGIMIHW